MKQHITKEQLQELDHVQLYKLKDILSHGDPIFNIQEKLNIGKMIEILRASVECFDISPHNNSHIGYTVGSLYQNGKYNPNIIYKTESWLKENHTEEENKKYYEDVFCDALWKAVKEVLK